MKMRASFGKVVVCALAGFCIFALALFFAIREDKAASETTTPQNQALAAGKSAKQVSASDKAKWMDAYGNLPMGFEENRGQTDGQVRFVSHGEGYELFLTPREAVLALSHTEHADFSPRNRNSALRNLAKARAAAKRPTVLQVQLSGANPDAAVAGLEKLPGRTNYFLGNDRSAWRTDIASYRRVKYSEIYPGVDLVFYGNQRQLEYDYVVAPGADPQAIAFDVKGARKIAVDAHGNLVMSVVDGDVELQKPVVYQDVNGQRRLVAANYAVSADHRVTFALGAYDKSQPLTIDPILNYSTYLGGSANFDAAYSIAVDALGDAYLTGVTFNTAFPLSAGTIGYNTNSPDPGVATDGAAFVSELDPTGSTELYFTYLGGSGAGEGGEFGFGIAVDANQIAYVTGFTLSTNYPTQNGYISSPLGSNPGGTAFLTALDTTMTGAGSLVYSTYVGGTSGDFGNAVAVDSSGDAFVTGFTISSGIATAGALQTSLPSTSGNAFLTEINTTASLAASEVYSTYLGGSGTGSAADPLFGDEGFGVAVTGGQAYIIGTTTSQDFPTTSNAFIQQPFAAATNGTVFFSVINPGTNTLAYSSFISGATVSADFGYAVGLGPNNIAYLTGATDSNFYVTDAISNTSPLGVVFLTLVDATQSGSNSIPYSTIFGGTNSDLGYGVKVDSSGNAYIGGVTDSVDPTTFPITPGALQNSSTNPEGVAFITEIDPGGANGSAACSGSACIIYSTLFGGSGAGGTGVPDRAYGLALDSLNNAYIGGQVGSTDFPVFAISPATPFQSTLTPGDAAGFAVKLTLQPTVSISPLAINFGTVFISSNATQQVTVTNNTGLAGIPLTILAFTGANAADFGATPGGANPCGATLAANNTPCTINVTFTPSVNGAESATLPLQYAPYGITNTQSIAMTGAGSNVAVGVTPTSLTFAGQLVSTTSPAQIVTVSNNGATSLAYTETLTDPTGSYAVALPSGSPCTGGSIPANTSCTINVTFTPTSANANPVTATLALSAGGLNQNVSLSGTAWDFSLSPQSQNVSAAPGVAPSPAPQITVTLLGGFAGPVSLSCSGSIPMGSCTVPSSVSTTGAVTVTLMTAGSSAAPPVKWHVPPVSPWQKLFIGLAILSLLAVPFARQRRQKISLAGALVLMIALTACSGSAGTPAGTYNLTITGSSGGRTQSSTIAFTVT
jgi:hypothetical protein